MKKIGIGLLLTLLTAVCLLGAGHSVLAAAPPPQGPQFFGPGPGGWPGAPGPHWTTPPQPCAPVNPGPWPVNPNPWNHPPKYNPPVNPGPWPVNPNPKPYWNHPPQPSVPVNPGPWPVNPNPNPNWNNPPQCYPPVNPGRWEPVHWVNNPTPVYQEPVTCRDRSWERMKADAGSVIHRTALVIMEAQRAATRRNYSCGLSKAVAHQQKARDLYWRGSYRDAIFHSLRARDLAFQVLNGNHEPLSWNYCRDEIEETYCREAPRCEDMDGRLDLRVLISDVASIFLKLDIDIKL